MESVAAGDQGSRPADGLAAYYAATGTPPGRFLGAGLADLDDGNGLDKGTAVSEDHLRRMLGEMCDPVTGDAVGQTPIVTEKRVPVAGFDLTFSPSKSVSVAWALADPEIKETIYDCHRRAIDQVLCYAERHVLRSRSGPQGVVEENIGGVVAAAFTHWDSRAGDPQLHDHVVVWNRARSLSDGRWRTLDSRGLFKAAVMLSELHQGVLSDLLTEALGVGWDGRERRHSDHRRYEITGVPEALLEEFSKRSEQVEKRTAELVDAFVGAHGRRPTAVEAMRIAQQATLETRPAKAHRRTVSRWHGWPASPIVTTSLSYTRRTCPTGFSPMPPALRGTP
jgi:conjugative relaxase-like TrwC/TraI family protein